MNENQSPIPEAIKQFLQLNTEADKELQDIVNLAAEITEAPVALLTILDKENQWFKVKKGIDLDGTPREIAFCSHAVTQDDILIVPDTLSDDRFTENPLVTGEYHVRFYAGATLTTSGGDKIGTLCVLDRRPRQLTQKQVKMLTILSQQAINKLELLLTIKNLNETLAEAEYQKKVLQDNAIRLRAFFEGFTSCYLLVDREFKILDYNNAALMTVKRLINKDLWVGKPVANIIPEDYRQAVLNGFSEAFTGCALRTELRIQYKNEEIWWEMHFCPARDIRGEIIGVSFNGVDITENKKQQQAILIQNSSLRQIAYIQSHEFRKPVTTIMGLMHLIKENGYADAAQLLPYMEQAVQELDEKIKISVDYTATISVQ